MFSRKYHGIFRSNLTSLKNNESIMKINWEAAHARRESIRLMLGIPRRIVVGVMTIATVFVLWWLVTSGLRLLNPIRLPAPGEIWVAFLQILARGYAGATLWEHALHSLAWSRAASPPPSSSACRSVSGWVGAGAPRR